MLICVARGRDHEIQYCGWLGRGQTRSAPPQEGVPDPKDLGKWHMLVYWFKSCCSLVDNREFACFSARTAGQRGVAPHHPRKWKTPPLNCFVVLHGGMGHEYAKGVREEFLARGNAQGHELGESGKTNGWATHHRNERWHYIGRSKTTYMLPGVVHRGVAEGVPSSLPLPADRILALHSD